MLATRTDFSLGESVMSIDKIIEDAVEIEAKAVAITDTMSVTALIDFTNKANKADIKPIIGCRLRMVDDVTWRKTKEDKKPRKEYFVTWYVKSEEGLKALYRILSLANSEERFYMSARLSFDDLYNELKNVTVDDVLITTSDLHSVILHKNAYDIIKNITSAHNASQTFINLVPIDTPYWDSFNNKAIELAKELGLTCFITRQVYHKKGDSDAAEIMGAIIKKAKIDEPWHVSNYVRDLHAMNQGEFMDHVRDMCQRLDEKFGTDSHSFVRKSLKPSAEFIKGVDYGWVKQDPCMPEMAPDEYKELVNQCKIGWGVRFGSSIFGHKPKKSDLDTVYIERLKYELGVLKELNFSGYFLLVQDLVKYSKDNDILVGPGRGSVGGSLVAYLTGITECDPIRFGLLFERFINPARNDLPDADLDFMSSRRHEVIEYLSDKYGSERVAGISNFLSLGARSSIRDVSRAIGLNESVYSASKFIPDGDSLEDAAENIAEISTFKDNYEPVWTNALALQGVTRGYGQHAAGIVVAGCDLTERSVLERRKPGEWAINWDKRTVEDQGLIKMDILGLSTLDQIAMTMKYVLDRRGEEIDISRIPLDDPKVLEGFSQGLTTGVFQFESGGMRNLLKQLSKGSDISFEDITAATALYRPGPMESGMMDSYWKRKQGREPIEYDHPKMEKTLEPTFGVMVYQEQVMQVARDIAGYSMSDADTLRKIMGKKLPEAMKAEKGKFVEGCISTVEMARELAEDIFDKIEKFAGYGFNKSHSVEYTLISWQSMYLKTYYPVEFFAAAMSIMKDDRLPALMKDAERLGVTISLPDINKSAPTFNIVSDHELCIPFTRIKGISANTANAIMVAREDGLFTSMKDLEDRVEKRKCHKGHREKLDLIGAFASIEPEQLPCNDVSRIKDQIELLPGLVTATVPIHRKMNLDKMTKAKLVGVISDYFEKHKEEGMHVKPTVGARSKFVIVVDTPTSGEEQEGKFSYHKGFVTVQESMNEAELIRRDAYWTGLIKRPKEGRQVSVNEIKTYVQYLDREIEILKPPVIVLLGSQTVRHFIPDFKGKASDEAGKIIYNKELDANMVIGFNPGEIFYDETKQELLDKVFQSVRRLI